MQKRRFVALTVAFALVLSIFVGVSTEQVSAASKKYEVPVKVIHYSNGAYEDDGSIEKAVWSKDDTETFKYNKKGYVTSQAGVKTSWTLKGSKRVKATTGSKKWMGIGKSTYKSDKLQSIAFTLYNKNGSVFGRGTEKYSSTRASKGWISKISGGIAGRKYTVTYAYKFYSNGMPKTIKVTEKENGETFVAIYSFNSKGLITKVKGSYDTTKYTYKYKGGKPVERYAFSDGMLIYRDKLVYGGKYTNDRKTYVGIINTNMMNDVSLFVRDAIPPMYPLLAK